MVTAIYRAREDGDFDFVAAIGKSDFPTMTVKEWAADARRIIGEPDAEILVIRTPLAHLTDVLSLPLHPLVEVLKCAQ